jgi:DNA recombination protein Rad52
MTFSHQQLRKLKAKLNPHHVRLREADGQTLHYLEGWHVVMEANRIFGFDGWDRETISNSCVWTKQTGARYCAAYVAKVRITVRADGAVIIREASGAGDSNETSPGQAHDRAAKAAETDATKRALTTFGNCFGLTLYAGTFAHDQEARAARASQKANRHLAGHSAEKGNGELRSANAGPSVASVTAESSASQQGVAAAAVSADIPATREPSSEDEQDQNTKEPEPVSVDKSVLAIAEPRRVRDTEHLRFVADQACMICGREPCEAHHLRHVQPRALGRKTSDAYTVPLCALHHRELHARGNERAWWAARGRDPLPVADQLWRESAEKRLGEPKPDGVFG